MKKGNEIKAKKKKIREINEMERTKGKTGREMCWFMKAILILPQNVLSLLLQSCVIWNL